ncbi:MAG: electron transfer flavoprotein subunit alpha/FixB family protein [Chloroflexota bacterium]
MAEHKGVMVCGEAGNGKLASITAELLGCGRKLADQLGEEVSCILLGDQIGTLSQDAIALGADRVFAVEDPLLKGYVNETYTSAMEQVVKEASPRILLLGQTALGRDLAPRLAFRLNTALTTDCVDLALDSQTKLLQETHPVYGGNARAIFASEFMPQMATVRQKAMSALAPDPARKGQTVPFKVKLDAGTVKAKVLQRVKEEAAGVKLEDAKVIVSGGRGIGGPDGFKQLEQLAQTLKGAMGASRPPCDNGWVPTTAQVGLTGKIVTPDLYIAVAISGASQHIAGCSGARTIVAINKDPEANIFREAHFGVVGDWKQVLPAFAEKLKELLAG